MAAAAKSEPATGAPGPDVTERQSDQGAFTHPVPLTRPPMLLGLTLAIVLLSIGFYAVFTAQVTAQVDADGVMLSGGVTQPVVSPSTGQVSALSVSDGDQVAAGQQVASLFVSNDVVQPVITPVAGEVLQRVVRPGEVVDPGDPMMYLFEPSQPLVVTTLVPVADAVSIKAGQAARVLGVNASSNSPGYVAATVAGVAPIAVDSTNGRFLLDGGTQNDAQGSPSTGTDAQREVTITFPGNPTSVDQLQWEGTAPAESPFAQGAVVKVEIITGEKSVVSLLRNRS